MKQAARLLSTPQFLERMQQAVLTFRTGKFTASVVAQVRAEYIALYKQYAPLWEKEETERAARWARFLEDGTFSVSAEHAG